MPSVDRAQYEVLMDDEVPYNTADVENPPTAALQLDSTHNLDVFFSQIYDYHQEGGFTVCKAFSLFNDFGPNCGFVFKTWSICILDLMRPHYKAYI